MRLAAKLFLGFAGFLLIAVLVLFLLDWNLLRPYIAQKISEATGRSFAINGDLSVQLSLHPRIIANDIVMANAAWGNEPNMLEIPRLKFRVDLLPLLAGRLNFPVITLSAPRLVLEVHDDGTPNWRFGKSGPDEPARLPGIGVLTIDDGRVSYRDPRINSELAATLQTLSGGRNGESMVEATVKGRYKGLPVTASGRGGALLSLRSPDRPYPITLRAELGTTKVSAEGVLIDPLQLKGQDLRFTLEGSDLAQLYPLVGVPVPPTPPYRISGGLNHAEGVWTLRQFKGRVGKSDLGGDLSVDATRKPLFIKGDVASTNLDMADLGGLIGGKRGDRLPDKPPPPDKLLPIEPFNLEKLRAANVDLKFRAAKIITGKLPVENMQAHVLVDQGRLKLAPLNFSLAGGRLETVIEMDGSQPLIATQADIDAKGLRLAQLMPTKGMSAVSAGTLGGRAKLAMKGNSVARMLGSANGEAALIMDGGTVSELLLRLSNLDIANSLARLIGGDKQTTIRCLVSQLNAVNGDFIIEAMVLDTPKVNVYGTGHVDMRSEALNLRLEAESKSFSLASLRGPIAIGGTFKAPTARPEMGRVIARGGLAAVLGSVTAGIGALIPLLELGEEQKNNCAGLIARAKADVDIKTEHLRPQKPRRAP